MIGKKNNNIIQLKMHSLYYICTFEAPLSSSAFACTFVAAVVAVLVAAMVALLVAAVVALLVAAVVALLVAAVVTVLVPPVLPFVAGLTLLFGVAPPQSPHSRPCLQQIQLGIK